jgi:ppGpp synthetase/RelA/SpoT-type nucleotidyltranferase
MQLDEFLNKNGIAKDSWDGSELSWDELEQISEDHNANKPHLLQAAQFFANIIQGFQSVHSVRWRVKDTGHLLAKIIRKKSEGSNKYSDINASNYMSKITDLVGIRVLHLFKDDCFEIDRCLREVWEPIEPPVAYMRTGDPKNLIERFRISNIETKDHPYGYRSVHYIVETKPTKRSVIAEIQVRTIFEEEWSEIDHRVRYPNFSDDQLVAYFLTILNRLAGSADEMGTFVQELTSALIVWGNQLAEANRQKVVIEGAVLKENDKLVSDGEGC